MTDQAGLGRVFLVRARRVRQGHGRQAAAANGGPLLEKASAAPEIRQIICGPKMHMHTHVRIHIHIPI